MCGQGSLWLPTRTYRPHHPPSPVPGRPLNLVAPPAWPPWGHMSGQRPTWRSGRCVTPIIHPIQQHAHAPVCMCVCVCVSGHRPRCRRRGREHLCVSPRRCVGARQWAWVFMNPRVCGVGGPDTHTRTPTHPITPSHTHPPYNPVAPTHTL